MREIEKFVNGKNEREREKERGKEKKCSERVRECVCVFERGTESVCIRVRDKTCLFVLERERGGKCAC
jgi:hypothetical protein